VEGEVHVDFPDRRADRAHGVGADRVAIWFGLGAPGPIPVRAGRQGGEAAAGQRQDDLDALVESVVGEPVEVVAGERDAQEGGAEPVQAGDADGEEAPSGDHNDLVR
jgi:hypothetical protein